MAVDDKTRIVFPDSCLATSDVYSRARGRTPKPTYGRNEQHELKKYDSSARQTATTCRNVTIDDRLPLSEGTVGKHEAQMPDDRRVILSRLRAMDSDGTATSQFMTHVLFRLLLFTVTLNVSLRLTVRSDGLQHHGLGPFTDSRLVETLLFEI